MSVPETGAKLCLVDLAKRLEDLRLLCELERRTLARQRLCLCVAACKHNRLDLQTSSQSCPD